ncbi:MAG: hypothetical protein IJV33_03195 [Bacteroidaceae bacterium]|nr:hypothetical protein [Bacteroidaceae bacterium]
MNMLLLTYVFLFLFAVGLWIYSKTESYNRWLHPSDYDDTPQVAQN